MAEGERPPHDPTHVPPNFRVGLALSRSLAFFVRHVRLLAVVGAAIFVPVLLHRTRPRGTGVEA